MSVVNVTQSGGYWQPVVEGAESFLKKAKIGVCALLFHQKAYKGLEIPALESLKPTSFSDALGKIALFSNVSFVALRILDTSRIIFNLGGVLALSPLSYVCPIFGAVSLIANAYQTAQECMAPESQVPTHAKIMSVAILLLLTTSVAISCAAIFVGSLNPYTLPLTIAIVLACVVLAYLKYQAIVDRAVETSKEVDVSNTAFQE